MMEKSALADEVGEFAATPSHSITITHEVAVYAPAERAGALPVFHLYALYVLCGPVHNIASMQCCGSGSGIRCLFDPWIRDG
jgi:hypothetical protein